MRYTKKFATSEDLYKVMTDRGLTIHNSKLFVKLLKQLGFQRLDDYCDVFLDSKTRLYRENVNISDVYQIIKFDERLCAFLSFWLLKIEKAVRAGWIEYMAQLSDPCSPFAYLDSQYYHKPEVHDALLKKLEQDWFSSNDLNVQRFRTKYNEQVFPPIWHLTPVLTFGGLSKWISALNFDLQRAFYETIGLPRHSGFSSTALHSLTVARNVCAHGGRVWSRLFPVSFVTGAGMNREYQYKVRALIELLDLVITRLDLNHDEFVHDLSILFYRLPKWQKPYMGWQLSEPIKWTQQTQLAQPLNHQ